MTAKRTAKKLPRRAAPRRVDAPTEAGRDWREVLREELQRLQQGEGLNAHRVDECDVLPDLRIVRERLAPEDRESRDNRVREALQLLQNEINLLRSDDKGDVLRAAFAIGQESRPRILTSRLADLPIPSSTVRGYVSDLLLDLHARVVGLEERARRRPEIDRPSLTATHVPYKYLSIDATYRFANSRVPTSLDDVRTLQARVDGCSTLYRRTLYTGGLNAFEFGAPSGGESDPDYEPVTTATQMRIDRLRFKPLAAGEVKRISDQVIVVDRESEPEPFIMISADSEADVVRVRTEFPIGDVPDHVERIVSYLFATPIPVDHIPIETVRTEGRIAETVFEKVDAGLAVGMRWNWPSR